MTWGGACEWWWELPAVCDGENAEGRSAQLKGPLGPVLGGGDSQADRIGRVARSAAWQCASTADEHHELAAGFRAYLIERPDLLAEHTDAYVVKALTWHDHNRRRRERTAMRRNVADPAPLAEEPPGSTSEADIDPGDTSRPVWVHGRALQPEAWLLHDAVARPARRCQAEALCRALASLDPVTLKIAELIEGGATQAEAGAMLGITQQAVHKRLQTARKRLAHFQSNKVVKSTSRVSKK